MTTAGATTGGTYGPMTTAGGGGGFTTGGLIFIYFPPFFRTGFLPPFLGGGVANPTNTAGPGTVTTGGFTTGGFAGGFGTNGW